MGALLLLVGLAPLFIGFPPIIAPLFLAAVALLAVPHLYLGAVVEKGRGRSLQTVIAGAHGKQP